MNTVIYGGSFNPPHIGHIRAAEAASRQLSADRLIIIPDNIPPHKALASGSPSADSRYEMCVLAFSHIKGAQVSRIELDRGGTSYTSDTVASLRTLYPNDKFFLVMGTDMLTSFTQWHEYRYLLSECTLAVLARDNGDEETISRAAAALRDTCGGSVAVLRCDPYPASSTEIRNTLALGLRPDALTDSVYDYIKTGGLY